MQVLLLNQTFYPDVAATAQYLTDLALGLVRRGHEVTVITSRRGYDSPDTHFTPYEKWNGITIHRVPAAGFGKTTRWRRSLDFLSFIASCALQLVRLRRQDAVIALTSPPLIAFLAAWYCRLRGAKLFYWVMDLNPDAAVVGGWLKPTSMAARCLEAMSRFSFRHSHRIIVLDRFMRDRVLAKGIPSDRIEIIPPWAQDNLASWDPVGRETFRRQHGLTDKFVVMYSGNHSPCHPLDTFLQAARQLANDPRFAFCFIGGGSLHEGIRSFAERLKIKNFHVLPYSPLRELGGSLSGADLQMVVMGEKFVGMIHPCKIYNVLMVGAPVVYLGPDKSHITDVFEEVNDPDHLHHVRHGQVDRMVEVIRRAESLGSRGSNLHYRRAVERYGASNLLERQLDLIDAATSTVTGAHDRSGQITSSDPSTGVPAKPSLNARSV